MAYKRGRASKAKSHVPNDHNRNRSNNGGARPAGTISHLIQRAEEDPGQLSAAEITRLQQTLGNKATSRLLHGRSQIGVATGSTGTVPAVQMVNGRRQGGTKRRFIKSIGTGSRIESSRALFAMSRKAAKEQAEADLREKRGVGEPTTNVEQAGEYNGFPTFKMSVEQEDHHLFVDPDNRRFLVASMPLPVKDFLIEMDERFKFLENHYETMKVGNAKLRGGTKRDEFVSSLNEATTKLGEANNVFGDASKGALDRLGAQQILAKKITEVIKKVKSFADRLGKLFSEPGKSKHEVSPSSDEYARALSSMKARYRLEGLVARWEEHPFYGDDASWERDHQPHNDLIETIAALPQFEGRRLRQIAAGRTSKGWAVMLHHERHHRGRTYGAKGGTVTAQFRSDLAAFTTGGGKSDEQIRDFCINYLINSLKEDANAMKVVADDIGGSYPDIDADPDMGQPEKDAFKQKLKNQIVAAEDLILQSEGDIRDYKSAA